MFGRQKWVWIAVIAVASAAPAAAQQGGTASGGRTTTGGQIGTSSGSSSGGFGGSSSGGFGGNSSGGGFGGNSSSGGFGGNNSSSNSSLTPANVPTLQTSSSSLQKSNLFAGYYANPFAMGLNSGTGSSSGSFGSPAFGTSSGSSTSSSGRSSLGGSLGSQSSSSNQSGILIPLQSQMNYTGLMKFDTRPVAVNRLQSELRVALDGTSMVANPKGVQVLTDNDNNVTLRGTVTDDDEARLVEGIVRLTPGVGAIKNELTFPATSSGARPPLTTAGR